jgi:hypothetical protein
MSNELQWIWEKVVHGLIWGTALTFIWRGWDKPRQSGYPVSDPRSEPGNYKIQSPSWKKQTAAGFVLDPGQTDSKASFDIIKVLLLTCRLSDEVQCCKATGPQFEFCMKIRPLWLFFPCTREEMWPITPPAGKQVENVEASGSYRTSVPIYSGITS